MPFALIVIGLLAVMSAIKGTQKQLGALVVSDFTGQNSFLVWMAAVMTVGLLGYVPALQKFSRAGLVLVILAIILSNSHANFFTQLYQAFQNGPSAVNVTPSLSAQTQTGNQSGAVTTSPQSGSLIGAAVTAIGGISGLASSLWNWSF